MPDIGTRTYKNGREMPKKSDWPEGVWFRGFYIPKGLKKKILDYEKEERKHIR
jgi:hypothetical protein